MKRLSHWLVLCISTVLLFMLVGCGVDPDLDGPSDARPTDGSEDTAADVVGDAETTGDLADTGDTDSDTDGDANTDQSDVTIETCNGHCDCGATDFCSNTGTCQPIIGPDIYYCCEDTGPTCPEGQPCHIPGTFGNSGTCSE